MNDPILFYSHNQGEYRQFSKLNFEGGIGNRLSVVEVNLSPEDEKEIALIQEQIKAKKFELAEAELVRRKKEAWEKEVANLVGELFSET